MKQSADLCEKCRERFAADGLIFCASCRPSKPTDDGDVFIDSVLLSQINKAEQDVIITSQYRRICELENAVTSLRGQLAVLEHQNAVVAAQGAYKAKLSEAEARYGVNMAEFGYDTKTGKLTKLTT